MLDILMYDSILLLGDHTFITGIYLALYKEICISFVYHNSLESLQFVGPDDLHPSDQCVHPPPRAGVSSKAIS